MDKKTTSSVLIGITGYKGHGKDTAVENIPTFGLNPPIYQNMKFAAPIKAAIRSMMMDAGYTHRDAQAHINGSLKEIPLDIWCGHSTRYAMQTLGTEWGRNLLGTDVWVNIALSRYDLRPTNTFITDLRFKNEEKAIRDRGGYIIRITNPAMMANLTDLHPSEGYIGEIKHDLEIINNDSMAALGKALYYAIQSLPVEVVHETTALNSGWQYNRNDRR